MDRPTYLSRFKGVTHDALEVDTLAAYLRETFPMIQVELSHREQDRWPGNRSVSSASINEGR